MFHRSWHRLLHANLPAFTGLQPLSNLPPGQTGIVVKISGGNEFLSRMLALGLSPGAEVTVLQNHIHGPILTCVRESRLALGRGEAQKILLEVCNDPNKHPHHS